MQSNNNSFDWLLEAALQMQPGLELPEQFTLSTNIMEAWTQVASLLRVSTMELGRSVAQIANMPFADTSLVDIDALQLVPEKICRSEGLLPLRMVGGLLQVAVSNPANISEIEEEVKFSTGRRLEFHILPPDEIDSWLTHLYSRVSLGDSGSVNTIDLDVGESGDNENLVTVRLAKAILRSAIEQRASDIHLQPFWGGGAIRFRVDGRMTRIGTIPSETLLNLSRYFMTQSGADTSKMMQAQDGRLALQWKKSDYDVRLSFLPAHGGMRMVARVLSQNNNFTLEGNGFSVADQQAFERMTSYASGIILMTGPTGSGKTTTLYSLLASLNSSDTNIMTIENPVEYVMPGLSQTNINEKQGLTFASSLRAILRQDPDVVLVGEIRDGETANIAAQAALTGHLVFSTLHTNDAITTIPRLLNLGLDSAILADSLAAIISQRLVRALCTHCAVPASDKLSAIEQQFQAVCGESPRMHPVGCQQCNFTGYHGRLPLIERLEVTASLRAKLLEGERDLDVLKAAAGSSYRSMAENAMDFVVSGKTSIQEVHRVLGVRFWHELAELHGFDISKLQLSGFDRNRSGNLYHVLLITEDQALADELSDELGYEVEIVPSVEKARQHLEHNHAVFAMVADSRVAHKDMMEWLKDLRGELAWSGLPVIFLGDAADEALQVAKEHNADVVQGFPVDVGQLAGLLTSRLN